MADNIQTKQSVSIIPSLEMPGIENTLGVVEALTSTLAPFKSKVMQYKVSDSHSYAELGGILSEVRAIRKQGVSMLAPFEAIVDRVRDFLRTARLKHVNACEQLEGIILPKMKQYENDEREAAAKEQAQIEKKTGEEVTVKPNLPTVAGYRKTVNYYAEIEDFEKFMRAYVLASPARRKFLVQFLTINEKKLAQYARDEKNEEVVMAMIPACRAWRE